MRVKYAQSNGGNWFYYIQVLKGWWIFKFWTCLEYDYMVDKKLTITRPVKFDTCQEADEYVRKFQAKAISPALP